MPYTSRISAGTEPQKAYPLVNQMELLSVEITLDLYSHDLLGMQEEAAAKVDTAIRTAIEGN